MIVTVTVNPAVDKTLIVHGFRPGATNRATVDRVDGGGKGINVARNLRQFGCDVIATGFLGADDRHGMAAMLGQHAIQADFVPVVGESRVNLKIIDPSAGVETEINEPGFVVTPDAIDVLAAKLAALAREASVVVFSGSLPPGSPDDLYSRLLAVARAEGVATTLDTAGNALGHGLAAGPDVVKPNRAEAEEFVGAPITDEQSLVAAAHRMLGLGARRVVISLGADGAISASADGMWRAHVPAVMPRSTVGAGDAMMAALAYGLVQSLSQPDALRLATAAGCAAAAAVERYPSWSDIQTLLPQILIAPIPVMPVGATQGTR